MATVGSLNVKLSASAGALKQDLDKSEGHLKGFAGKAMSLLSNITPTISLDAVAGKARELLGVVMEVADEMERMGKIADAVGDSVGDVSRLMTAADLAGIEGGAPAMKKAMMQIQTATAEALRDPASTAADTFERLGINAREFADLPIGEKMRTVAEAIKNLDDKTQQAEIGQRLFSKGWVELAGMMRKGADGIDEQTQRVDDFRATVTEAQAASAASMKDQQEDFGLIAKGFKQTAAMVVLGPAEALQGATGLGVTGWLGMLNNVRDVAAGNDIPKAAGQVQALKKAVDESGMTFKDAADAIDEMLDGFDELIEQGKQVEAAWQKEADALIELTTTPLQKYERQLERVNFLERQGLFTLEQKQLVVGKLTDELTRNMQVQQAMGGAGGAAAIGSQEALTTKALTRRIAEDRLRGSGGGGGDKVVGKLEELRQQQAETNRRLGDIGRAVGGTVVTKVELPW